MATSQNGWPAYNTSSGFTRFAAAGGSFLAATEDVAFLAAYLIRRFDAEVERIAGPVLDDWSWANRNVRGSDTEVSNHASATAWDLNALKHPRGVRGTFTAKQLAAIDRILGSIIDDSGRRVFRHGETYVNSPVDGMHFELNVGAASVRQARARIEKTSLAEQQKETDMEWSDKIKLTATDAAIWTKHSGTPYEAGAEVSIGTMLRYPTLARKTDTAVTAQGKQITALTGEVAALKSQLAQVLALLNKK